MASFPKDKPSYPYYRVVFRKTYRFKDGTGKKKAKTFYFRKTEFSKAEVKEWKKRKEIAFKDGDWQPWDRPAHIVKDQVHTLKKTITEYLARAKKELSPATITAREGHLGRFKKVFGGSRRISSLSPEEIEGWINDGSLKYKSRMKRLECVNALYSYAQSKGIARPPDLHVYATRAEKKKAKRADKTYITPDEFGKVKDAAKAIHGRRKKNGYASAKKYRKYREFEQEFDWIFDFLVNTAIRRSDFINLNTAWFIRDYTMMRIGDDQYRPKSQEASETIPLTPEAQKIAKRWIRKYGENTRPFSNIKKDWFTRFFKEVFKKALPEKAHKLSAHKLRDTAAMYLLFTKEYSPQTVQLITRHEDLSTLMIYTHSAPHEGLKEILRKG